MSDRTKELQTMTGGNRLCPRYTSPKVKTFTRFGYRVVLTHGLRQSDMCVISYSLTEKKHLKFKLLYGPYRGPCEQEDS